MDDARLAAIVLTMNEEKDLPGCLASLREIASEIYVIDSGSSDRTVAIAEAAGARVFSHPFTTYSGQVNWALQAIETQCDWFIRLDADERVEPGMRASLKRMLPQLPASVSGVLLARRTEFLGRRLRFGMTFPIWLLRVWRRGRAACEDRLMDEHMVLTEGSAARADGELLHVIPKSLAEWSRKHVFYAELECSDVQADRSGLGGLTGPARRSRFAKQEVYYRLPPLLRAVAYFSIRYFLCLGFLDGRAGFLYHFLQGAWYRILVDGLLEERRYRLGSRGDKHPPS